MSNSSSFEQEVEKKFSQLDERKKKKMKVSGKAVFKLKKIINQKADRLKSTYWQLPDFLLDFKH